ARAERERAAAPPADAAEAPPDEQLAHAETLRVALEELERLTPTQRRAIVMRFLEQRSVESIGEELGILPSSVRTAVSRGLEALRVRMDRRLGGRAAWPALLWPGGSGREAADSAGLSRPTVRPARARAGLGAPGAAVAVACAGAAGVTVLGLLLATDLSQERAPALDSDRSESALEAAAVVRRAPDGPSVRGPSSPSAAETNRSPAQGVRGGSADGEFVLATFVDARTGEPVAGLEVTSKFEEPSGDRRAHGLPGKAVDAESAHAMDIRMIVAATDEQGRAQLVAPRGAESVKLELRERHGTLVHSPGTAALPIGGPIEVPVGPTFTLDLRGPAGRLGKGRAAFYAGECIVARTRILRDQPSGRAWVRFSNDVAELRVEGPLFVEVTDEAGRARGRAEVTRSVGIERAPVRISLAATGGLRVTAAPLAGLEAMDRIELRRAELDAGGENADGVRWTERGDPLRTGETEIRHLEPGAYAWRYGAASGTVDVVAGEVTDLKLPAPEALFRVEVVLERGALPGEASLDALIGFFDTEDPTHGYAVLDGDSAPIDPL
ncbi:MAG: sigma-70 family RNA polymerase sigma factor, partial [Planctomycetota bacterium]